jgi:hypothetical protein
MKRPILINGLLRQADIHYLRLPEFEFLDDWERSLGKDTHPVRIDAVNFATLACKRFQSHASVENYAASPEDLPIYVKDNPNVEVAFLAAMVCKWFSESDVIGIAHFRRSWTNNLILDYLVSHPWIASPPPDFPVKVNGVGLGLMYHISKIAVENQCGAVWGEATQNSCDFYKGVFKLDSVQDLLYIPNGNLVAFLEGQDIKWQERKNQYGR